MIGRTVANRYEIEKELGLGGMATVYLATDINTSTRVAIKFLHIQYAKDYSYVERFNREAETAIHLDHPNIVRTLDYGAQQGEHFIVMEYVEGKNLAQVLQESGKLPKGKAISIAVDVASALEYAAGFGITHRDIKPHNIMLTEDGQVKVADFGIAKVNSMATMTNTGVFIGSPNYISPEQAKGEKIDVRSDIYSLGIVLYEMLEGRSPFQADTPWPVINMHITQEPPIANMATTQDIKEILAKCLKKDRDERYQNASELASALRKLSTTQDATKLLDTSEVPTADMAAHTDNENGMPITDQSNASQITISQSAPTSIISVGETKVEPSGTISQQSQEGKKQSSPILKIAIAIIALALVIGAVAFGGEIILKHRPLLGQDKDEHQNAKTSLMSQSNASRSTSSQASKLATANNPTSKTGISEKGKIAFVRDRDSYGYGNVWVMNADGSNQINLTNSAAEAKSPAWSPDRSKIAYIKDSQIWCMDSNGGNKHLVIDVKQHFDLDILWSGLQWRPSDKKIVLYIGGNHTATAYVINEDGTGLSEALPSGYDSKNLYPWEPVWSRDGQKTAGVDSIPPPNWPDAPQSEYQEYLVVADASGRNAVKITKGPNSSDLDPCWSPNGKELAYERNYGSIGSQIIIYDLATRQSRILASGGYPTWSPDGNMIAYNTAGQVNQIWVINADGSNPHKIADNASYPVWQPSINK